MATFFDGSRGPLPMDAQRQLDSLVYQRNSIDWNWLFNFMKSFKIKEFETATTSKYGFRIGIDLVKANL